MMLLRMSEAAMRDCALQKEVFLEISQIHRKTAVPESFFNKVAGLRPTTLLKKETGKVFF